MLTVNRCFHRFDLFLDKVIKTLEKGILNTNEWNKQLNEI